MGIQLANLQAEIHDNAVYIAGLQADLRTYNQGLSATYSNLRDLVHALYFAVSEVYKQYDQPEESIEDGPT